MTILIDYLSDEELTIYRNFSAIQKRFFDPYSISITTETNKQVFISEYLNNFLVSLLGTNNEVLSGLITTVNSETDTYVEYSVSKGLAVSDTVLIEFTDDMLIRIPKDSQNTLNTNQYGLLYIDYRFVKTYPYNVAIIKFVRQDNFENILSGIPFTPISLIYNDGTTLTVFPSETDLLELPDNIVNFINSISNDYIKSILQNSLKPLNYRKNITEAINNIINLAKDIYLNFLDLSSGLYSDLLNLNQRVDILEEYVTNQIKKSIPLEDLVTGKIYHLKVIDGRLVLEDNEGVI